MAWQSQYVSFALAWLAKSKGEGVLMGVHVCSVGMECMLQQGLQCLYPCLATIQNCVLGFSFKNNLDDRGANLVGCDLDVY